ncbi:MAG: hypothetical protein A2X08_10440 [Bacteroidetes bacterium GWA2_32_17]|nr:MAG: hypothetical protein A2X08_10440 [Bacteroidetes bacterium GWA2_32_17]
MAGAYKIRNYTSEFTLAGTIYNSCLDNIVSNIDVNPTSEEILDIVKAYFYNTYFSGRADESIPRESINVITTRALNNSTDFLEYLDSLEISKEAKDLVKKIYLFSTYFQKYAYTSDKNIFNYSSEAGGILIELNEEIQNAKISVDQKILPQIALTILQYTFNYWTYVYTNYGGSNAWYTYLLTTIGGFELSEIDWRKILSRSIAGGICGAINGFVNDDDFQSITIGAAAGAATSSAIEVAEQIFNHLQITDGLLTGGEEVFAASGNAVYIKKHVVNITRCKTGEGVTLPRAKAGNIIHIKNSVTANARIAPKSTDLINGSSGYVEVTPGDIGEFYSAETGNWITGY